MPRMVRGGSIQATLCEPITSGVENPICPPRDAWNSRFVRCTKLGRPYILAIRTMAAYLSIGIISCATCQAAFPTATTIQRLIDERVAQKRVVGAVIATRDSAGEVNIFHAGTSGRAGVSLDGDTLFEIGSITKTFTAELLADMAVRGELKLDDPIKKYLTNGMSVPRRGTRHITFVDLATHTSGLPGQPANIQPKQITNPYVDYTEEMLYEFLATYGLPREIGSQYEYSAVGYGLLGHALGQRLGKTWEAALTERILVPLGMTSTCVECGPDSRLARGHDESGKVVSNWDIPTLPAMGALRSSANDMLKYLAANMDPSSKPLGEVFAMAHEPRATMDEETRVGLAWQTGHGTNRTIVWHGGGTGGYRTLIAFDPTLHLGVVVLTNSASGADDIGFHLLDRNLPLE
jgi:serine-type D-Ala-D-Ala carboxypeptidase/endopeptidase